MTHSIFRLDELEWIERDGGRRLARLSDALTQARANVWRYPPGAKGVRHLEKVQEEIFVVVGGRLTLLLGDPAEPHELGRGDVAVVRPGRRSRSGTTATRSSCCSSRARRRRPGRRSTCPTPSATRR